MQEQARLTGHFEHYHSPPNAPTPADQAEQDREQLGDSHDEVDAERAYSGLKVIIDRESWLADAQAQHTAG